MASPVSPTMAAPLDDGGANALQQSAIHKNAWRMLPVLTLGLVFNYIDRTSIGFAGLTMNDQLGFTSTQFGWAAGILFVGYCFFEVPSNLALHRVGARRWLARIMISWGLASAATALVRGPASFYLLRFLLGMSEAGYFPGVVYLLANWFPAQSRTRVLAVFTAAVPLSSVIGGPFSALLLQLDGMGGLTGWQWMFIVQGLPACIIGAWALLSLRDHVGEAHWLSAAERDALARLLEAERRERAPMHLRTALRDRRVLLLAAIQFGFVVGSYGIGIWLPIILKGQGLHTTAIGFASAVPYLFATAGLLFWARAVDRGGNGTLNLAGACALGSAGLIVSVFAGSFLSSFAGLTLALIGVTAARAIFWTIPARFLSGLSAAGGIAFINVFGALGGFVGPSMVGLLKDATGSFTAGLAIMAALGLVSVALTFVLRSIMVRSPT